MSQNLLSQVKLIVQKYHEGAKLSGENFNIFKILGVESDEVRMHSAFVAELLNPKGSHELGTCFLKLFLDQFFIQHFHLNEIKVEVEKHVGYTTDDTGGRIDIVISDSKGNAVLIENKIYAGDQKNQLIRYHNYDRNAHLFYLTLDGKAPSEWSQPGHAEFNKDLLKLVSYKSDIVIWLESCRKEATNHPLLRETLTQYINLIKHLTNQTSNNAMSAEIKNLLRQNFENFKSAHECATAIGRLTEEILHKLEAELYAAFQSSQLQNDRIEWKDYQIRMGVDKDNDGFYFGFTATKDGKKGVCRSAEMVYLHQLLNRISKDYKNTAYFIGWKYPSNVKGKSLGLETIYNLDNDAFRSEFVSEIIKEALLEWNRFSAELERLRTADVIEATLS